MLQTRSSVDLGTVALSPDGRLVAVSRSYAPVQLWDAKTGYLLQTIEGNGATLTWSPDGRWLAIGLDEIALLDVASGGVARTLTTDDVENYAATAFSPDGTRFAAALENEGRFVLFATDVGREVRGVDTGDTGLTAIAFSPDGRSIATCADDGAIRLWDAASGRETRRFASTAPRATALSFSADGTHLVAAGIKDPDLAAHVFDVATGTEQRRIDLPEALVAVGLSRDAGRLALATGGGQVEIVDTETGRSAAILDAPYGEVAGLAFNGDASRLAAATDQRTAILWNPSQPTPLRVLASTAALIRRAQFSRDGRWLATASDDGAVRLWDTSAGRVTETLFGDGDSLSWLGFSGDSRHIAYLFDSWSVEDPGTLVVRDLGDPRATRLVRPPPRPQAGEAGELGMAVDLGAAAISHDGRIAAVGDEQGQVTIWDVEGDRSLGSLEAGAEAVTFLDFSPDGRLLASATRDGSNRVWSVTTRQPVHELAPARATGLAFSPDGKALAMLELHGTVRWWNVGDWRELPAMSRDGDLLAQDVGSAVEIDSLAWSSDGRRIAGTENTGGIHVFDVESRRRLVTLDDHGAKYGDASFGPGALVAGVAEDGTVRIWSSESAAELVAILPSRHSEDWFVTTPDGLFDGSPDSWRQIVWRFSPALLDVAPAEVFFNDYFTPGLLADLLAGRERTPPKRITDIDRRQPSIALTAAAPSATVAERSVEVAVDVAEAPADGKHDAGSGVQDVRLFRNGALVHVWRGDVLDGAPQRRLTARVPVVAGDNELVAYAFNRADIKSSDARLRLTGAPSLARRGTAYVIAVGIDRYANADYDLKYAGKDAESFLTALADRQTELGRFDRVEKLALLNEQATKRNLLAVLDHLARGPHPSPDVAAESSPGELAFELARIRPAEPEDAVFLFFAGHGVAHGARFHLVPHDLGSDRPRRSVDDAELAKILTHSVSDLELDRALERVDAGLLVLVIDACNSGQALEAEEKRRGPMNSKGLAQLAYEKGMFVLAAAQGYQAALETRQLGHGLLSYALVNEGLRTEAADVSPFDGWLDVREWLDYTIDRVPALHVSSAFGERALVHRPDPSRRPQSGVGLQRPRVFYRDERAAASSVVARVSATASLAPDADAAESSPSFQDDDVVRSAAADAGTMATLDPQSLATTDPALEEIAARLSSPSSYARFAALQRLEREALSTAARERLAADGRTASGLARSLRDEDERVRIAALQTIAKMPRALVRRLAEPVAGALRDPALEPRVEAAQTLAGADSTIAAPHLIGALADPDARVRAAAAESLAGLFFPGNAAGDSAARARTDAFVALLGDPDEHVRAIAANGLLGGTGGREEVTEALVAASRDPVPAVRAGAVVSLGSLEILAGAGAATARRALLSGASDTSAEVRLAALRSLRGATDRCAECESIYRERLADPDPEVAATAAIVLWETTGETAETIRVLVGQLGREDEEQRRSALGWLAEMGSAGAAALTEVRTALEDPELGVQLAAVSTLAALRTPDATTAIISTLDRHTDPGVQAAAARQLGDVPALPQPAIARLTEGLEQRGRRRDVRESCAEALGKRGAHAAAAVPALLASLLEAEPSLRLASATALGRIGSPGAEAAVPRLVELTAARDPSVRVEAALALWRIRPGDERVVPVLKEVHQGRDAAGRDRAATALGEIGAPAAPALEQLAAAARADRPGGPHWESRSAFWKVARTQPSSVSLILQVLAVETDDIARRQAIEALAEIGRPAQAGLPEIERGLLSSETRAAAAFALWRIAGDRDRALAVLIRDLEAPDFDSRTLAALKLGEMGADAAPAVAALVAASNAPGHPGRVAVDALGKIGAPARAALPGLRDRVHTGSAEDRAAAATAVERIEEASGARARP